MKLLARALPYLEDHQDEGPAGEGWQSASLKALIEDVRAEVEAPGETVYLVFREGVYRHECCGVFTSLDEAKGCANALQSQEPDDWHRYDVIPFKTGVAATMQRGEIDRWTAPVEPKPAYSTHPDRLPLGGI